MLKKYQDFLFIEDVFKVNLQNFTNQLQITFRWHTVMNNRIRQIHNHNLHNWHHLYETNIQYKRVLGQSNGWNIELFNIFNYLLWIINCHFIRVKPFKNQPMDTREATRYYILTKGKKLNFMIYMDFHQGSNFGLMLWKLYTGIYSTFHDQKWKHYPLSLPLQCGTLLPLYLSMCTSISTFCSQLKTHFFPSWTLY